MGSERGYIVVDDSGNVTANRQVDPVADIPLSGGGSSLPSWWTVDSTSGSESVDFAGAVSIAPSDPTVTGLDVQGLSFVASNALNAAPGIVFDASRHSGSLVGKGDAAGSVSLTDTVTWVGNGDGILWSYTGVDGAGSAAIWVNGTRKFMANSTGLGFFATAPVAKPTGVAVTAGGIHAALVTLGLISA